MELYDVVCKLIGPIMPIGETNTDDKRFESLKQTTELVDRLVFDIDMVVPNKNRVEFSMKRAGEFADKFLGDVLGSPSKLLAFWEWSRLADKMRFEQDHAPAGKEEEDEHSQTLR